VAGAHQSKAAVGVELLSSSGELPINSLAERLSWCGVGAVDRMHGHGQVDGATGYGSVGSKTWARQRPPSCWRGSARVRFGSGVVLYEEEEEEEEDDEEEEKEGTLAVG
jgi:hypothetical protein